MFFSIVPGMRTARRIGAAERRQARGDLEGAPRARAEALDIRSEELIDHFQKSPD